MSALGLIALGLAKDVRKFRQDLMDKFWDKPVSKDFGSRFELESWNPLTEQFEPAVIAPEDRREYVDLMNLSTTKHLQSTEPIRVSFDPRRIGRTRQSILTGPK